MPQDIAVTVSRNPQNSVIIDLRAKAQELEAQLKRKKRSNPAVVGLAGFGTTTFLLQFHNFDPELMSLTPIIWLGIVFGGAAQLVAGLQEYGSGNNFAYCAFSTYGAFWISFALFVLGHHTKTMTMDKHDLGFFMIGFTLYTFIMLIATLATNVALFVTFLMVEIGFILLDIGLFNPAHKAAYNRAAGAILFLCALGAWYIMAHIVYMDVFGTNVLPVGPAPTNLLARCLTRCKQTKHADAGETPNSSILKKVFHLSHR